MADLEDDGFNEEAFKGLGENDTPATEKPKEPVVEQPKADEDGAKKDPVAEEEKDEDGAKPPETTPPPAADDKKEEEDAKPPETPETPPATETPQPLTKDDVKSVVSDLLNGERSSTKELDTTTDEVLETYYPDGLSNVLTDESGKELKTPQDVVDASNGSMTTEEAAQWLLNEQFVLDKKITEIKNDARRIAETTVNFKRDSMTAVEKYEPLFKWQPTLQKKVYDLVMKNVKVDEKRGVVTEAPDVLDLYDTYLEPYQQAYEFANKTSATNPVASTNPEPPKPTAEDRMDDSGDGGPSEVNDPNDFAQQVTKELAKGA